jgi:hypothetical protein
MARPKSVDPKVVMTLRLPGSVVAKYEALGDGWRAIAEAVLAAHFAPAVASGLQVGPAPSAYGSRLKKR